MAQRHPAVSDPGRHPFPNPPSRLSPAPQNLNAPLPPTPPYAHQGYNDTLGPSQPPPPPNWQTGRGRQTHPKPTPPAAQQSSYNSNTYFAYQSNPVSFPQTLPGDNQPLTSATYIPFGESFGPGVGIPPLHPGHVGSQRNSLDPPQSFLYEDNDEFSPEHESQAIHASPEMNVQILGELNSPMNTDTARYHGHVTSAVGSNSAQRTGSSNSTLNNVTRSNDAYSATTPLDAGSQWPLDSVISWLAANSFSTDWQAAFVALDLHGSKFLELGHGHGGKGNFGLMHSIVYPQLAKECTSSGSGWDQSREREEGKRLRKLIRNIVDISPQWQTRMGTGRRSSSQVPLSSTAGPQDDHVFDTVRPDGSGSTSAVPSVEDETSTQQTGIVTSTAASTQAQRQFAAHKGILPSSSPFIESPSLEGTMRNALSEAILRGLDEEAALRNSTTNASREPQASVPQAQTGRGPGHRRAVSSESSQGVLIDGRRQGPDSLRYTSGDAGRPGSSELASSAKEHKNFLTKIMRRGQKKDDLHVSPEEPHLESPTSPVAFRTFPATDISGKMGVGSSDTSLDRPASSAHDGSVTRGRPAQVDRPRKYILVSPDRWNYRLVDITDAHSADDFKNLIARGLGLHSSRHLHAFSTNPGQSEHTETLSDHHIAQLILRSDATANMKFFVRTPFLPVRSPGDYGDTGSNASTAPVGSNSEAQPRSGSSPSPSLARWESRKEVATNGLTHRRESERRERARLANRRSRDGIMVGGIRRDGVIDFDSPRISPFEEKKFDPLVPMRRPPPLPPVSNTLIKANSLSKRPGAQLRSSWADREPMQGVTEHQDQAEKGRGRRLENSGNVAASSAAPANTSRAGDPNSITLAQNSNDFKQESRRVLQSAFSIQPSDSGESVRNPSCTIDNGNIPFKTPDFHSGFLNEISPVDPEDTLFGLRTAALSNVQNSEALVSSDSPDTSPSATKPPKPLIRMPTRKVNGPTFEFKETPITFTRPVVKAADVSSEDDSDDGLFAIPLKMQPKKREGISPSSLSKEGSPERLTSRSDRPLLTLQTSRSKQGLSVAFQSPNYNPGSDHGALSTSDPAQEREWNSERNFPESAASASWSAESPNENNKSFRRQSFASDVWAFRPPVEAMVDHLDEFFPNVDLDQPMLEDMPVSPSSSSPATKFGRPGPKENVDSVRSDLDTSGDTSTPRRNDRVQALAHRESKRSGGLGRTKSIREVVRGAYGRQENTRIAGLSRMNTTNYSEIGRRKSTKMFGAKIEQIKPPRGSRLINLETIPQDTLATAPQRQPTFKWVKGQLIGKGTFGRVYLGMNTTTGELLAVKQVEVTPKLAGGDKDKMKDMVKALDGEIDTMQHLDHMNIVQYLGCERKEYSISIFLEYIPGGSVGSCLRKHGKFEEPVVSSLTRQTLSGLAYLHHEGILHRDLKADNILLDNDGTCKISDFGISKKTDNIYGNDITNSMQGSVFWMAPEVVRSQDTGYSAKVDIWSLGCVVLEMFAGRRPWSAEEAIGAIYKLGSLNQAPPIPEEVSDTISPQALSFMYDCFNVDPADRPTADTLLRAPFCFTDPNFNFLDTDLYAKIRPNVEPIVTEH